MQASDHVCSGWRPGHITVSLWHCQGAARHGAAVLPCHDGPCMITISVITSLVTVAVRVRVRLVLRRALSAGTGRRPWETTVTCELSSHPPTWIMPSLWWRGGGEPLLLACRLGRRQARGRRAESTTRTGAGTVTFFEEISIYLFLILKSLDARGLIGVKACILKPWTFVLWTPHKEHTESAIRKDADLNVERIKFQLASANLSRNYNAATMSKSLVFHCTALADWNETSERIDLCNDICNIM
jgi:hypothetical protein